LSWRRNPFSWRATRCRGSRIQGRDEARPSIVRELIIFWRAMLRHGREDQGPDEARPSIAGINYLLEGHAPSWPTNPIPGDIENPSRVVCGSLSLRERERVRVRGTKILVILECPGVSPSPRPSPAGRGGIVRRIASLGGSCSVVALYLSDATKRVPPRRESIISWRVMLRHGPRIQTLEISRNRVAPFTVPSPSGRGKG